VRIKVEMDFSGDVEDSEMLELAKYVLDEAGESFHCYTKVIKIEEAQGDQDA
jgi:hypothetical protein